MHIEKNLQDLTAQLKRYEKSGQDIRLAVTEWGPFFHILPSNPWVDHIKTLGSALFVGNVLNVFMRSPKLDIANFFKLTDHGFMGWIGNKGSHFAPTAPYLVFQLYRERFGSELVMVEVACPSYKSPSIGVVEQIAKVPYLDVVASRDGNKICIMVVNKHMSKSIDATLEFKHLKKFSSGTVKVLTGTAIDAHTGTELPKIKGLQWAKQKVISRFKSRSIKRNHTYGKYLTRAGQF